MNRDDPLYWARAYPAVVEVMLTLTGLPHPQDIFAAFAGRMPYAADSQIIEQAFADSVL